MIYCFLGVCGGGGGRRDNRPQPIYKTNPTVQGDCCEKPFRLFQLPTLFLKCKAGKVKRKTKQRRQQPRFPQVDLEPGALGNCHIRGLRGASTPSPDSQLGLLVGGRMTCSWFTHSLEQHSASPPPPVFLPPLPGTAQATPIPCSTEGPLKGEMALCRPQVMPSLVLLVGSPIHRKLSPLVYVSLGASGI